MPINWNTATAVNDAFRKWWDAASASERSSTRSAFGAGWLAFVEAIGSRGGQSKSHAKAKAARKNGKKGGRPVRELERELR